VAPHRVQWLTDNGSVFATYRTLDIAAALNLEPCFTPVESPESNGMAEAFVKTFKRRPNAANSLATAFVPGAQRRAKSAFVAVQHYN